MGQARGQPGPHGQARAREARDEGAALAKADEKGLTPGELAEIARAGPPAQPLGDQQYDASSAIRNPAATVGAPNRARKKCSKAKPMITAGMVPTTIIRKSCRFAATAAAPPRPSKREEDVDPLAPEIQQQGRRGAHMQHDEEGQEGRGILVDRPAEQRRGGTMTAWARLLTGTSSVTPWRAARRIDCSNDMRWPLC